MTDVSIRKLDLFRLISFDDTLCLTGKKDLEWSVRELQSRAFLEETECQLALGNIDKAHHSLHAAEEAVMTQSQPGQTPCFPAQKAAIQLCRSRLAFQTCEDACKSAFTSRASWVSPFGHKCAGGKKKGSAKTQRGGGVRKGKASCKWRSLLESHLWSLLECLNHVHCIPLLYRSDSQNFVCTSHRSHLPAIICKQT